MQRYSVIHEKNKREIILLRGSGCKWRRCAFCDYHLDFSRDERANFLLNLPIINRVDGIYQRLEVINSGSFCDLDEETIKAICDKCVEKSIKEIHFECHWMHRGEVLKLRERFGAIGVEVKIKIGVETFDYDFREGVLIKGIDERDPEIIAKPFDEVCLLFGISCQTVDSMKNDVELGLRYFKRVCINVMCENSTKIKPDNDVISHFKRYILPLYIDNESVDILIENTDFGVGG